MIVLPPLVAARRLRFDATYATCRALLLMPALRYAIFHTCAIYMRRIIHYAHGRVIMRTRCERLLLMIALRGDAPR